MSWYTGSDHDGIQFSANIVIPVVPCHLVGDYSRKQIETFRIVLGSIPWDCCFLEGGVKEAWSKFKDLFLAAVDQCIPLIYT